MKRALLLLALVSAVLLSAAPVLADDMYVIIAGGGVGTKISSLPYTINAPGFYYVTGNLSCTGSHGIKVNANDVTIDLMGFCLSYLGDPDYWGYTGVYIPEGGGKNVEVRNGSFSNWRTGIYDQDMWGPPGRHRIINVRVKGRGSGEGIVLYSSCNLVKGCMISDAAGGITVYSSTITGNQVSNCIDGINACGAESACTISNNLIFNCTNWGIDAYGTITGNTINKCGTGIFCRDACIGNTVANCGTGIKLDDQKALVDRNTVTGCTTPCLVSGNPVWGINSGLP